MFIIGALKTYHAFNAVLLGNISKNALEHLASSDIETAYLIKALDAFLIAFVLFIFAYGIYSLFVNNAQKRDKNDVLKWIDMPSISHLKNVSAEVIVIIIFVKYLEIVRIDIE